MQTKSKNWFLRHKVLSIVLVVLLVIAVAVFFVVRNVMKNAEGLAYTFVRTTTLEKTTLTDSVTVNGTVKAGQDASVTVADTGTGIAPEHQGRIFERFYQVERHRGQNSTGLGLDICKHVIERHGGRIWAESPAEDGSTAIIFTLRRADAPRTPVQE